MVPRRGPGLTVLLCPILAMLSACGPPSGPAVPAPLLVSDRGGAIRVFELGESGAAARLVGSARADDRSYADWQPARLPDGRIAFVSDRGGRPAIYLTSSGSATASPLFAPAAAGGGAGDATDDSDPSPLGADRIVFARATPGPGPAAAPTGAAIAAPGAAPARDLWSAALDGSGARPLTRDPADDGAPCGLADGHSVAFLSRRGGPPRLFRLDATAPDPEATVAPLVAAAPGDADGAPACAPDGGLLFARRSGQYPPQIVHAAPWAGGGSGAGGANVRQITDAGVLPAGASEPVVFADGTLILTAGPGKGPDGRPIYALYRIAEGGYNLVRLTREQAGYSDYARLIDAGRR